jgi:excisionase family DNA binding protein
LVGIQRSGLKTVECGRRLRGGGRVSRLAAVLLAELDDAALDALAQRLAPRLAVHSSTAAPSGWLDVSAAAEHLACPRSRLYALVSARRIQFCKDGSRLLFDRVELDEWVRSGGGRRP